MGVAVDILVVLFLVWSLFRGWRLGFLFQLGQLAVIVIAYFVARGLGAVIAAPLVGETLSPPVANTLGFFLVFITIVIVGAILLRKITRDLLSFSTGLGTFDRVLGIALGGAKGLLISYVVIVGLIMAHRMTGNVPIPFGSSVTGRWVMQNNFLDSDDFPRAKALAKLVWLRTTRTDEELAQDPHVVAILNHPRSLALLTPEVLEAVGEGDFVSLLTNRALWAFLDEPDIQRHLNAIEWAPDPET